MKKLFFLSLVFFNFTYSSAQIDSGLLVSVHEATTTVEMNTIPNAKKGDLIFNKEANAIYVFNGMQWVTGGFKHTPYLTIESEITLSTNSTTTIFVSGVNFSPDTQINIPGLTINSFSVVSPTTIEVNVTTVGTSGFYDIIVNNTTRFNTSWANNEKDKIHVL